MFSKLIDWLRELSSFALRTRRDARPIRWWEYLLFLVSIPYCIASGIGLMLGVLVGKRGPKENEFNAFYQGIVTRANKIRTAMRSNNRYLTFAELDLRDPERKGTILDDEQGLTWWTSEDIVSLAPAECMIKLPYSKECADARSDYARYCYKRYYDVDTGIGYLLETFYECRNIYSEWPEERIVRPKSTKVNEQTFFMLVTQYDLENFRLENPSESENVAEITPSKSVTSHAVSVDEDSSSITSSEQIENAPTQSRWPIVSRPMVVGFIAFCILVILPMTLSVRNLPIDVFFAAVSLLVFIDIAVLLPIFVQIRSGTGSNECNTIRGQYGGIILAAISLLVAVIVAAWLLIDNPQLWLSFASHVILLASLHRLPVIFFYDPDWERHEELGEIAAVGSN